MTVADLIAILQTHAPVVSVVVRTRSDTLRDTIVQALPVGNVRDLDLRPLPTPATVPPLYEDLSWTVADDETGDEAAVVLG